MMVYELIYTNTYHGWGEKKTFKSAEAREAFKTRYPDLEIRSESEYDDEDEQEGYRDSSSFRNASYDFETRSCRGL